MFHINSHVKPRKESEHFGKIEGAYATLFIDYNDIDGAFALTKFYLENEGWEIIEIEEEYFVINSKDEMDIDYNQYYEEVFEYGYSLIFNMYEKEE